MSWTRCGQTFPWLGLGDDQSTQSNAGRDQLESLTRELREPLETGRKDVALSPRATSKRDILTGMWYDCWPTAREWNQLGAGCGWWVPASEPQADKASEMGSENLAETTGREAVPEFGAAVAPRTPAAAIAAKGVLRIREGSRWFDCLGLIRKQPAAVWCGCRSGVGVLSAKGSPAGQVVGKCNFGQFGLSRNPSGGYICHRSIRAPRPTQAQSSARAHP